jgi:hypothetical protein
VNAVNPQLTAVLADDVTKAGALFNESFTYLRLASDHAKFIRNYFDPTQETLFRAADRLAAELDQLRSELCSLQEPVAPAMVNAFVQRAVPVISRLITFKDLVSALVRSCQTQQLLPADFIDHLRREADFFLGIVAHVTGVATPTRARLHFPGPPEQRVTTIARALIDRVPLAEALAADLIYTEFWGKHHMEHAEALTLLLRPQQTALIAGATRFQDQFGGLLAEATDVERNPTVHRIESLNRDTLTLSNDWRNFLVMAEQAQRTCQIQTNFPQRLTEHIRIETDILMEAAARTARRLQQPGGAPVISTPSTGATFQNLTPKSILCS